MARLTSRDLFPSDEPIRPPSRLIGRETDIEELVGQLSSGVHRIVAAPRRTGKSTVCEATVAALRRRRFYSVSVSLFTHTNASVLAVALARETLANRSAAKRLLDRVRSAGALTGRSLTAAVRLKTELGDAVEIALEPTLPRSSVSDALREALLLPQRIADRDDRQLIVFIDELQELTSGTYGDPDELTKQLRDAVHASPRVTCLFAGSVEHMMRDLFTNRRRALYQFGGFHDLSRITEAEWRAGLRDRFAQDDCTTDEEALGRIITVGEGHPRATMLIAQQTHVAAVEDDTHRIDASLAERGYRGALAADAARHVDLLERIRSMSSAALAVTIRLANGRSPYAGMEKKSANRALNALADASIVLKPRAREPWRLDDPLFAAFLRREISA